MRLKNLTIFFLLGLFFAVPSFASIEPMIDVGLIFGKNNEYPIGINTESGIILEIEGGQAVVDFQAVDTFRIMKLGFYTYTGDQSAYVDSNSDVYKSNRVKGGYSVDSGLSFETFELAQNEVEKRDGNFYVFYDGIYRLLIGHFVTEESARTEMLGLQSKYPELTFTAMHLSERSLAIEANGRTIFAYDSERDVFFRTELFEVGSLNYRYGFKVKRLPGSDFTLINRLPMSFYLYGVLPKEMSGKWPIEALKAQAVAARSFALKSIGGYPEYEFDVCTTVNSQAYGGYNVEAPNSNLAVDLTRGMVLTYEDEIADCFYHSHSGGFTDDAGLIWHSRIPYISPVEDVFSVASGSPNTDWTLELSDRDIEGALLQAGYNIGRLSKIRILERTKSGRVVSMEFEGSFSTATLTGEAPRFALGTTVLKSMLFGFDAGKAVTEIPNQLPMPGVVMSPATLLSSEGVYGTLLENQVVRQETSRGRLEMRLNLFNPLNPPLLSRDTVPVYEEISVRTGKVVIYGHGYGHGLGMSQWGAKKMAELGYDYASILEHYYKDTELVADYNGRYSN